MFSPEIGPELAFIGFVQPATGGILSMSELQAQWLAMIIKGRAKLPSRAFMNETRIKDKVELSFVRNMFHLNFEGNIAFHSS